MKLMLEVKNINFFYGAIHALKEVSMEVNRGEIIALIGSNGAGKSTLLNVISGMLWPSSGNIQFEGSDITHKKPNRIVQFGIGHVPEGRQLFAPLTVMENLELGAYLRFSWRGKKEISQDLERVFELFPLLKERRKQMAGTLSGGERQMLTIGRALMSRPRLMLLDEPSLGLAPLVVSEIFQVIQRLKGEGTTLLLVEQNAIGALKIADRGYLMENGKVVLEGKAAELIDNEEIKMAYLGRSNKEESRHS
jgi:branched-chain amino acid transport system ATP-binding protein